MFTAIVQQNPEIDVNEPPSLYRAIIKKPDDRNGYEAFLLAIDMLKDRDFRGYVAKTQERKDSYLQYRKALVDRYGGTLSLIRVGLGKRIWDPRIDIEPDTNYPEIAWLDDVDSLFMAESYTRASIGNYRGAIQSLTDGYEFVSSVQRSGPLACYQAGIPSKRKLVDELAGNLHHCGLPELIDIEKWSKGKLANINDLLASISSEQHFLEAQLDNLVAGKWKNKTKSGQAFLEDLAKQKIGDQAQAQNLIISDHKDAVSRWIKTLEGPEMDWAAPELGDYSSWGRRFAVALFIALKASVEGLVVEREKMRMLILAARAYQYRWTFDKLPAKLEDFADAQLAADPLNGGYFTYEPGIDRDIKLFSKGNSRVPEIYLFEEVKAPAK
jgi:hypothetical protein